MLGARVNVFDLHVDDLMIRLMNGIWSANVSMRNGKCV